ncbi:Rv3235 family protein [Williamsia sp. MIQD14]|uniref:Rv3235 family protein n=1 Tax=Williamsia sp. MIQD14 TaxID=3425703 RepID=UPI003DA04779
MTDTGRIAVRDREVGTGWLIGPIPQCEPEPLSVSPPPVHAGRTNTDRPSTPRRPPAPPVGAPVADRVDPSARTFAVSALTRVLEVIDRRRPVAHLAAVAAPHIIDQVTALMHRPVPTSAPGRRPPTASLLRVHLQWSGPDAAEVTASYARGDRVHAVAARVQRVPTRIRPSVPGGPRTTELRWTLVNITTV